MNDLNGDCLIAIFRWLPLLDLTSISETCTLFKAIAADVFTSNRTVVKIEASIFERVQYIDECLRILKNFGRLATDVTVQNPDQYSNDDNKDRRLLEPLIDCYDGNLKSLKLTGFGIDNQLVARFQPICKNLNSLELLDCSLAPSTYAALLFDCKNLVKLSVSGFNRGLFRHHFPHLEHLILENEQHIVQLKSFLKAHQTLKVLELKSKHFNGEGVARRILGYIVAHCSKNLESLSLDRSFFIWEAMTSMLHPLFCRLKSLEGWFENSESLILCDS